MAVVSAIIKRSISFLLLNAFIFFLSCTENKGTTNWCKQTTTNEWHKIDGTYTPACIEQSKSLRHISKWMICNLMSVAFAFGFGLYILQNKSAILIWACGAFLKALINTSIAAKCERTWNVVVCSSDRPNYVNKRAHWIEQQPFGMNDGLSKRLGNK